MKSWSYFISIPVGVTMTVLFWYYLITTVNSGMFDALAAWIAAGLISHTFLIGISIHAYKTLTGTWGEGKRKRERRKRKRDNK